MTVVSDNQQPTYNREQTRESDRTLYLRTGLDTTREIR